MIRRRNQLLLLLLVGCSSLINGCEQDVEHALLISVRSKIEIDTLRVTVKQYLPEGQTAVFSEFETTLEEYKGAYVVAVRGEPLRLHIEFESPGSYALHIVGTSEDGVAISSMCREIDGVVFVEREVVLGLLPGELDDDGDTFPEEIEAFCAHQAGDGLPCDTSCNAPDYLAMADCNPPDDFASPPGCGAVDVSLAEERARWNPFATDPCGDCHDQDCFSGDAPCEDRDGDGFSVDDDCDDDDPNINPGADEICGNGVDENCAQDLVGCVHGDLPCDEDGDGFHGMDDGLEGCGTDCDDSNERINPDAFEGCGSDPLSPDACPGCPTASAPSAVDDDCDGQINEGCFSDDIDGDGLREDLDCNDCDASVGPGFTEVCGNGIDEDCNLEDLACSANDTDGDGFSSEPEGSDCDDGEDSVYPGAPDFCDDGVAQDCVLDRSCSDVTDADGDHFGADEGDCDDTNNMVHPWAEEACDELGVDEDCDGQVNEIPPGGNFGCEFSLTTESWSRIEYESDTNHCGGCRHRCCAPPCYCEGQACEDSVCSCNGGDPCRGDATGYCCEDGCQDLREDENCGACGNRCLENEECSSDGACGLGACSCPYEPGGAACPRGEDSRCCPDSGCANTNSDVQNCGGCGIDCTEDVGAGPSGDICGVIDDVAQCYCGAVGVVCTGSRWCTDVTHPDNPCGCKNLDADEANCGSCDNRCRTNEECVDGACLCVTEGRACGASENCCPGLGCVEGPCECEDTMWMHCGGRYCSCRVTSICCDGECIVGSCCVDADCPGGANPHCDVSDYSCFCAPDGKQCNSGHNCCPPNDEGEGGGCSNHPC